MKDGGWLDNYNDSEVFIPEGFVGEGTFNGPKFDNPAWGGQFQEGGEISMAQNGTKELIPSYQDFLKSIKKDKVVDYKKTPRRDIVVENTKTILPKPLKKLTKEQAKIVQKDLYENPIKREGITSGDKRIDFLYNNEWLMDTPIIGDYIKDKARELAGKSNALSSVYNIDEAESSKENYDGSLSSMAYDYKENKDRNNKSLLNQYFSDKPLYPKSKYKPTSDYYEFLPSYSLKENFEKNKEKNKLLNDAIYNLAAEEEYTNFIKNKKPIYLTSDYDSEASELMNTNLGGHKEGLAWDKKRNLPYLSISDAWDFEPNAYANKWQDEVNNNREYIQSYLMHKAGNPFKVYDRFYFNPETKEYIPDNSIQKRQTGGSVYPVNYVPEAAMGGSIPGAVGFTYARTQGAAPSNGPYAKKTMASAQNGKEMQYYQQGLDWQPKTISKNGGWLDNYDKAQEGTFLPSVRDLITDTMNRKIQTRREKDKETNIVKKDNTKTVTPKIGKVATAKEKEQRAIEENKQAQEASDLQARKDQVFESMQEAYKSPLMSPGYFTPEGMAVGALQGALKMPGHISEGDTWGVVGDAAMMLPFAKPAVTTLGRALGTESGLLSNAYKYNPLAFKPNPEAYYRGIGRSGLDDALEKGILRPPVNTSYGKDRLYMTETFGETNMYNKDLPKYKGDPFGEADDDWIEILPKDSKRYVAEIPKNKTNFVIENDIANTNSGYSTIFPKLSDVKLYKQHWLQGYKEVPKSNQLNHSIETPQGFQNRVFDNNVQLGQYKGVGHLSEPGYNYRVLSSEEIEAIRNSGGVFSRVGKQKGGNKNVKYWTKGNEKNWYGDQPTETIRVSETNFDPDKVVNSKHVELYDKQTGKFKPLKQGGIIKDDRGQWGEHKGEPTRINQSEPGSYIDMGPDPLTDEPLTQPLLGISDKGERKIMYPGEKHKYKKGTKYVDEFPMAKNGMRQEQKGLVNLDQLTNFTNYNTKQPGGWLDTL
jgi:hypothetical protein